MDSVTIGTVSHGTMRDTDLAGPFGDLLAELDAGGAHAALVKRARFWAERDADCAKDYEDAGETVAELFNALSEYAPAYCYFGANEGDGSDYGFWPSWDSMDEATHDGELLRVNDLADVPADYAGDVMVTNDHGNVAVGAFKSGEFARYWDCV